jgi:hypothetical protein
MKRIVCLANSRKMSGRYVAGYELIGGRPGGWVRPVSSREHEEVALEEQRYENGEIPQLLDIIDIPLGAARPRLHQPENWLLNPNSYWTKVGRFDAHSLPSFSYADGPLWVNGYHTHSGLNDEVPTDQLHNIESSLKLISVSSVEIHVYRPGANFGNPKRRVQAHFSYGGVDYQLWVTDPLFEAQYLAVPDGVHQLGSCYLTVSIGEPYGENCYKLIAAVIGATQ